MNKVIFFLLVLTFIIQSPLPIPAEECMDGDCENGIGTGFTEEGKVSSGEWHDGLPHGRGILTISKNKQIEGRWDNGELVEEMGKY